MTENEWLDTLAYRIIANIPGHDYNTARTVAENHLSGIGGWNGTTETPVNNETIETSISSITTKFFEDTKVVNFSTITVTMRIGVSGSYAAGISQSDILTDCGFEIVERLNKIAIPGARVVSVTPNATTSYYSNGLFSSANRVAFQGDISGGFLSNPAVIAVNDVRQKYNLNSTWMAEKAVSVEDVLYVYVRKFTNTNYTNFDTTFVADNQTRSYQQYIAQVYLGHVTKIQEYPKSTIVV